MKSMTGYGRASVDATEYKLRIEVEMTSVNRKTLDAQISCPREWNGLEQRCHTWLKQSVQRGRVQIQIKVESTEGAQAGLAWSAQRMDESLRGLRSFAESRQLPFTVDSHLLLDLAKTVQGAPELPDWRPIEQSLQAAFNTALTDLDTMRVREGDALANDLGSRLQRMELLREQIGNHAARASLNYRDALINRLKQLQLDLDLNDERVLKEIALFADRSDITEELTRLSSHFEQFRQFIDADDAIGRKMDFLCQEIHREWNTIGSKSAQIEITRAVIEAKNELERIREQVQNVE